MKSRHLSLKVIIAAGFILIIAFSAAMALSTYSGFTKMQQDLSSFNSLAEKEKHISNFLIFYLDSQVALNRMLTIALGTEEAEFRTSVLSMETSAEHLTDVIDSIKMITSEYSGTVERIITVRKTMTEETDFKRLLKLDKEYEDLSVKLSEFSNRILTAVEDAKAEISLEMERNNIEQNHFMENFFIRNTITFIVLIVAGADNRIPDDPCNRGSDKHTD